MKTAPQRSRWLDLMICTGLLLVFLGFVIPSILNFSRTSDEGWLIKTAHEVASTRRWDSYDSVRHPPLSFYTYGFFLSDDRDPHENLVRSRLFMLIYPILLGVLIYGFTRGQLGRIPAAAALFLFATHPNILAHSSLITTDLCSAATFFLAFLTGVSALRNRSGKRALLAGLCLGAALLAKYTGILLIPILFIVALMPLSRKTSEGADSAGSVFPWRELGLILFVGLVTLNLGYGFDRFTGVEYPARSSAGMILTWFSHTVPFLPAPYVIGLDRVFEVMELGHPAYFLGEFTLDNAWYFYPAAFIWKEPLAMLILLSLGLGFLCRRKSLCLLLIPVVLPLLSFMFLNNNFVGLRHLLVIYPFLFVFSALPFSFSWRGKAWMWVLPLVQLASTAQVAPHYLAYFNEAAGGPEAGDRYLLDSNYDWGQDYNEIQRRMESAPFLMKDSPGITPTLGHVAVSPMDLKGYPGTWPGHAWLEGFEPVERIGFTWRIYDLNLSDFEKAGLETAEKRIALGWAYHESSRPEEALKIFRENGPAAAEALVLLDQGQPEAAEKVCMKAPESGDLFKIHAFVLEQLGNRTKAEALCLKSMADDVEHAYLGGAPSLEPLDKAGSEDALSLNHCGYLLWRKGELDEGARFFQLATEKDPLFADPWGNLAAVSAHLCERELLREYETRDGTADPFKRASYAEAALRFRLQYLKLCTMPNAWWAKRVQYRNHVAIYPDIPALPLPKPNALHLLAENRPLTLDDLLTLGKLYLLDEDYLHAFRAFLSVEDERPDDAACLYHLGVVRFRSRLYQQANASLNQALKINPDYSEAQNALMWMERYMQE
ncbi:MAG: glycosyltransferase family 39 protein [Planctomycetota bacterium]